jgi:hypothetical protein
MMMSEARAGLTSSSVAGAARRRNNGGVGNSQSGPFAAFSGWGKRDVRVSDADREAVVESLRRHAGDGRLSVDELTTRVEEAYHAKTFGELEAVQRDLPRADFARPQVTMVPTGPTVIRRRRRRSPAWLAAYLALINLALVAIWAATGANLSDFWPVWPIIVSAVLVAFRGLRMLERGARARQDGTTY